MTDTAAMPKEEIAKRVMHMAAKKSGLDVVCIRADMKLVKDLGFDSLNVVEFVMDLEDEFGLILPPGNLESWYVEKRSGGREMSESEIQKQASLQNIIDYLVDALWNPLGKSPQTAA